MDQPTPPGGPCGEVDTLGFHSGWGGGAVLRARGVGAGDAATVPAHGSVPATKEHNSAIVQRLRNPGPATGTASNHKLNHGAEAAFPPKPVWPVLSPGMASEGTQ